ncbi:hypothetical protein ISCGN_029429 [Ixodes scapularis]
MSHSARNSGAQFLFKAANVDFDLGQQCHSVVTNMFGLSWLSFACLLLRVDALGRRTNRGYDQSVCGSVRRVNQPSMKSAVHFELDINSPFAKSPKHEDLCETVPRLAALP